MSKPELSSEFIDRAELIKITGLEWHRLKGVVLIKTYGFPEPAGSLKDKRLIYKRVAVMAWLEKNDLKSMNLPTRANGDIKKANAKPAIDKQLNVQFLSGQINRPVKPAKHRPWTRTIHLKETHPEPPLNPNFTRHSWGDTDHRLSMSADHY